MRNNRNSCSWFHLDSTHPGRLNCSPPFFPHAEDGKITFSEFLAWLADDLNADIETARKAKKQQHAAAAAATEKKE